MQGFNMGRYVPPEHEGLVSANQLARKPTTPSTIRFEMPFPIWCGHCPRPTLIPQGVRFNATKRRTGAYFSTPIFSFRMKHVACGGEVEITTDPQNTAYVVTSGGRRQDLGLDKEKDGAEVVVKTDAEREDAFAALEGKKADRERKRGDEERIEELQRVGDRDWGDVWGGNRRVRRWFRGERKGREKGEREAEQVKGRLGLDGGFVLQGEKEEDRVRAGLVAFGRGEGGEESARVRPLFEVAGQVEGQKTRRSAGKEKRPSRRKVAAATTERERVEKKRKLASEIRGNSRAVVDPFLAPERERDRWERLRVRERLKRVRSGGEEKEEASLVGPAKTRARALVDYDSD